MKKINKDLNFHEIIVSNINEVVDSSAEIYKVILPTSVDNEIEMQKKGFFLLIEQ